MPSLPALLMVFLAFSTFETGSLRIESQPGVEVVWEGVRLGSTDARGILRIDDSPLGVFSITLRKDGFRPLTTEVEVEPGQKTVRLELEPVATPASQPSPEAASRPAETPSNPTPPSGETLETRSAVEPAATSPEQAGPATAESLAEDLGTSPPEPLPPPPAPAAPGTIAPRTLMSALLGAVLLGAVVLFLVRRRRPRPMLAELRPADEAAAAGPPSDGREPFASGDSEQDRAATPFLEDLKRRERALEDRENPRADRGDDDIIDVEATEVRPGKLVR